MPTNRNDLGSTLETAADWFVHLNSGRVDHHDWQHFQNWLECDAANKAAWQRIETLQQRFGGIPKDISKATLNRSTAERMTCNGKLLSISLIVGVVLSFLVAFSLSTQFSQTNYYTVKGETRTIELVDGTKLTLNTNTNIAVKYDLFERNIHLRTGEILIDTAPDTALFKRDFNVDTVHGRITALGTRFQIRLLKDKARVSVFEGRVAINPGHEAGKKRILDIGQASEFASRHIQTATRASHNDTAWTRGMFIADGMRLCSFVTELGRYHNTVFHCPNRLGELRISGTFPLDEPERVLNAITLSLPVEIQRTANGTILLRPRS